MSKHFVFAGGSHGIGREIIRKLVQEGHSVHVFARTRGDLENEVVFHECDFTSKDSQLGDLPEAIHGAAYFPGTINLRSFRGLKIDDFERDLEVNFLGAVKFLQACLPGLKRGSKESSASVLLFSTVAVQLGLSMHASIAGAKGAVEGLARSLAAEWAPQIRVNCLAPGLTDTPLAERFFETEEKRKTMDANYPLGRSGKPQDLASIGHFLLSDVSDWITGQVIAVDGGLSSIKFK